MTLPQGDGVEFSPSPPQRNSLSRGAHSMPWAVAPAADDTSQGLQQSPESPRHADPGVHRSQTRLSAQDILVTPARQTGKSNEFVIESPPRNSPNAFPKDTPFSKKISSVPESFEPNKAGDMNKRHAQQQARVVVGPMPATTFFNEFFSQIPEDKPMPNPKNAFKEVPRNPEKEEEIYDPLARAVNSGGYCPSIKLCNTSTKSERSGLGARKTDCMGYSLDVANELEEREQNKKGRRAKSTEWIETLIETIPTNLGISEMLVEIKLKGENDPFIDVLRRSMRPKRKSKTNFIAFENFESETSKTRGKLEEALGQITAYAAEVCERQHRTHFFSVLIVGTHARLLRWDRAGVIVTESFDYQKEPELLCEFFWRLHLASPVERGYDPTVTIASQEEEEVFKKLISEEVAFQLKIDVHDEEKLNEALTYHYQEGKVTKVEVYNKNKSQWEYFLVSVPIVSPKSAAGRGTRAYWAVRLISANEGEVCFLKDTWRVDIPGMTEEGLIYEEMHGKVENICKVYAHGYVLNIENEGIAANPGPDSSSQTALTQEVSVQSTRTQDFIETEWFCTSLKYNTVNHKEDYKQRITKRVHYRLILQEVGYPLTEFESASELFGAARDVLGALSSASDKCGRLHRDVGIGNIVLSRCKEADRRRGLIVDWEFSMPIENTRRARDYFRSVQWIFASGESLHREGNFLHTTEDDMESLFYVVMYGCIRWIHHDRHPNLGKWIYEFFDCFSTTYGYPDGGLKKYHAVMKLGRSFLDAFQFARPCIQTWFFNGYKILSTRRCYRGNAATQWSASNLMKLLDRVCNDLVECDEGRFEHDVSSYHKAISQVRQATHTTLRKKTDARGSEGSQRKRSAQREKLLTKRQRIDCNSENNPNQKGVRRSARLVQKGGVQRRARVVQKGEGVRRSARLAHKKSTTAPT